MKKFLVILMVVAMASFLFVGCMPSVTPPVEEEEEEEVEVAKTETPYITNIGEGVASISLSSTSTQYTNDPTVKGVGVAGAVIKVYIDGVQSGVGSTATTGNFGYISVSMVTLTEGVKKLYVTATQPGLAESDKSTEYTFTYDETAPSIASVIADSSSNYIKVTFDGDVEMSTNTSSDRYDESAMNPLNWSWFGTGPDTVLAAADIISKESGKCVKITPATDAVPSSPASFYITCLGGDGDNDSGDATGITDLAGNSITTDVVYAGLSVP